VLCFTCIPHNQNSYYLDALPLTGVGKIDKKLLRQRAQT
jgi:non-ribosomal peptide synthetase component E (peptide arylation enzyme)